MVAAKTPKTSTLMLSASWQLIFVAAAFIGWLTQAVVYGSANVMSGYISSGTFVFELTIWLLPLALFVAAFGILVQYAGWLRRAFMACLAATIGWTLYNAAATWERYVWNSYFAGPDTERGPSWWTAFGNEWLMMAVSLVLFMAGLYYLVHRRKG